MVTKDISPEMIAYGNPSRVVIHINDLRCKVGIRKWAYRGRDSTGSIEKIIKKK